MAKDAGWGRRLRAARRAYTERHDRALPLKEIGERVGAMLGREAFKHSTVRAWFAEGQEPDSFDIARAIARVLETDIGELVREAEEPPPPAVVATPNVGEPGSVYLARVAKEKAAREGGHKKKSNGKR